MALFISSNALLTNNATNMQFCKIGDFITEKNSKPLPMTSAIILLQRQHKQVLFRSFLKTKHRLPKQKCDKLLEKQSYWKEN